MYFGLTLNPIGFNTGYMVPWGADMFRGIEGSMNIQWNQGIDDLRARNNMWQVPTFDGICFSAYPSMANMNILLDPNYTINQMRWNASNCGSFGAAGANNGFGGFGATGINGGFGSSTPGIGGFGNVTSPFSPFGAGNSNGTSNSSSSSANSAAEKSFQKKYNKTLNFLKQLNKFAQEDNSHILNSAQKEKLEELIKGSKEKTYEGKYNELKDFYNSLNKEDIKKFLLTASKSLPINGKNGTTLYKKLEEIGFENENGSVEKVGNGNGNAIVNFHERLEKINKSDAKLDDALPNISAYSALDIISSYNSKYTDSKDNMIDMFFKAYDRVKDEQKDTVKSGFKPLVDTLSKQAREVADEIGGESRKEIVKVADDLDKAFEKFNRSEIKSNFQKLYVMTRIASAKVLENTLAGAYGDMDDELFTNNSFILEDTIKDLKEEGFDNIVNSVKSKINLQESDINTNVQSTENIDEIESVEEKINTLKTNDIIKKSKENVTVDGEEEIVYEETISTGSRTTRRKFIVNDDGMFVEIKKEGNDWKTIGKPISASTIQSDVNKAKSASTSSSKKASKKSEGTKTVTVSNSQSGLTYTGSKLYRVIHGYTEDKYYSRVDETLGQLNSKNIVAFLKDYYTAASYSSSFQKEGILEHLDDERDGGKISMSNKKNMINSLLERAKELGLENDSNYKEIEDRLYFYESGEQYSDKENFNNGRWFGANWGTRAVEGLVAGAASGAAMGSLFGGIGAFPGAVVGGLVGGLSNIGANRRTDNEYIDMAMKNLLDKIVAKEAKLAKKA